MSPSTLWNRLSHWFGGSTPRPLVEAGIGLLETPLLARVEPFVAAHGRR